MGTCKSIIKMIGIFVVVTVFVGCQDQQEQTPQKQPIPESPIEEKAHTPTPPKTPGENIHRASWITLLWKPGSKAVSHDVYMGDKFDEVNEGMANTFRGNHTNTFYIAGFIGYAYPDGLVPGTTYYWRIDEVNEADPNSPWKGDVWSFTVIE